MALGNLSVVKPDVPCIMRINAISPNKVIRGIKNLFHHRYVLMEDMLQMPKELSDNQKIT